jgi:hypothetical protein
LLFVDVFYVLLPERKLMRITFKAQLFLILLGFWLAVVVNLSRVNAELIITGVFDGPLSGGEPKIVELYATADIPDLSTYGLESATNAAVATAAETSLSGAISTGEFFYLYNADADDPPTAPIDRLTGFLGFTPANTLHDSSAGGGASFNGDDGIVLWNNGVIIDRFGNDADADEPGEDWDYQDGWSYRVDGTGPDVPFVMANWMFSGENVNDGETDNASAAVPFPTGTYLPEPIPEPTTIALLAIALLSLNHTAALTTLR